MSRRHNRGNPGTGETPTHTYAKAKKYAVTLTVQDVGGVTSTVKDTVTVGSVVHPVIVVGDSHPHVG